MSDSGSCGGAGVESAAKERFSARCPAGRPFDLHSSMMRLLELVVASVSVTSP